MRASGLVTVGMDVERNAVAGIVERRVRRHAAGAGYGFRDRFSRKFRQPALRQSFRSAGGERISRPCTEARAHFVQVARLGQHAAAVCVEQAQVGTQVRLERGLFEIASGDFSAGHPLEQRSEEHTSELQSPMRISYSVFYLKKK